MRGFGFKGLRIGGSRGGSIDYDPMAQALFDDRADIPTIAKQPISNMLASLRSYGYLDNAGFYMLFCVPTLDPDEALIEIKSLTTNSVYSSKGGTGAETVYPHYQQGFKFEGGVAYITTDMIPNTFMMLNNSCEVLITYSDESDSGAFNFGAYSTASSNNVFTVKGGTGLADYSNHTYPTATGRVTGANTSDNKGVYLLNRESATNLEIVKNGSVLGSISTSAGTLSTVATFLNTFNLNGTPQSRRNQSPIYLYANLGSGVSSANRTAISTIFETFQTSMQAKDGLETKQIVTHGNSHFRYYQRAMPRKIIHASLLEGFKYDNLAVSGQTTQDMITAYPTDIAPLYNGSLSRKIYIANEITNDFFNGATKESAFQNMKDLCLLAQATGFEVVVCGIPARTHTGNAHGLSKTNFNLEQDWIQQQLRDNYTDFADYFALPPSSVWVYRADYASDAAYDTAIDNIINAFNADKTHPLESTYYDWAAEIESVI